jgi:hypothetical protein
MTRLPDQVPGETVGERNRRLCQPFTGFVEDLSRVFGKVKVTYLSNPEYGIEQGKANSSPSITADVWLQTSEHDRELKGLNGVKKEERLITKAAKREQIMRGKYK